MMGVIPGATRESLLELFYAINKQDTDMVGAVALVLVRGVRGQVWQVPACVQCCVVAPSCRLPSCPFYRHLSATPVPALRCIAILPAGGAAADCSGHHRADV